MKISIRDISKLTGYSPATVSNALNRKQGVNPKTAEEIIRVATETGYISGIRISKIKLVIFRKNGSIIDDTPFFASIINGFEQECRKFHYEMLICNVDQRDSNYEQQVMCLITEADSAVVVLGTEMAEGDLDVFRKATSPLIIMDHWDEQMQLDAVLINNVDSAKMATQYLIDKGHLEVGYIRSAFRIKGFRSRYSGYAAALRKNKLKCQEQYIFTVSPNLNDAYKDMCAHLEGKPKLPSAFFADNDLMALGVMKALQEHGYRIPEDISIVGFDDLPFCEISSPRLTTVKVPNVEMGKMAVRRIVNLIENPEDVPVKTEVSTRFIVRETILDKT